MVVAALLGKKDRQRRSPLLSATGPVKTEHVLPGRVRFQLDALVADVAAEELVEARLAQVTGVRTVAASVATGSVLIHHDPDTIQPELLCVALVRLLGLEKELELTPQPVIARELRDMAQALNRAVYEQTGGLIDLWTALPVLLAVLGGRQLLREGIASLPTGFALVWWAYTALLREGSPQHP